VANPTANGSKSPDHWRILARRLLVDRSPYALVWDEDVQLPNGETVTNFTRIELPSFVIMVVLMEDGTIPFVRQYRQGLRDFTLELPAGRLNGDEEPLLAAQRELLEETGVYASDWQFLGKYVMDPNRQCGWAHTFMARGGRQVAAPDHGDLGDLTVNFLPIDEMRQRWLNGEFVNAPSTLCIGLAIALLNQ
jgi:ADP-ribose pyrophosphatase